MKYLITKAYTESKRNFFTDIAKLIIFVTIICCSNCSRESTKSTLDEKGVDNVLKDMYQELKVNKLESSCNTGCSAKSCSTGESCFTQSNFLWPYDVCCSVCKCMKWPY